MEKRTALKLNIFEQQISQLQEQISLIEQTITEMKLLKLQLNELVNSKGKEIFSPIGKGIFIKAKIQSEELIVDIGEKNFVKKSIPETKKLIEQQIEKLEQVKGELEEGLEKSKEEMEKISQSRS